MPLKDISDYWTSGAASYDKVVKSQLHNRRSVRIWRELLQEGLGLHKDRRVLDAGTGPGFFSLLLTEMGHRPTAVDASPGMVETAARNFREAGIDVPVYEGDTSDLYRESDDSYDAVVCRDVVWTLPDPAGAYAEWHRILKPGGRLVVFDGNYLFDERKDLKYRLWFALSWVLILLTERRMGRRTRKDRSSLDRLPFTQVLRPEADETALEKLGFILETSRRDYFPGYRRSLQYLKYGYQTGVRFMIVARKAETGRKL
ncbi:class I SAM-dependent methyltransferase [Cohnella lupini]|uniref:Ubiquinone/menaquinone biosynthesis C-methylase UbiE n=1 Tax=Cohnella lupini TaxID=1294267 RepID=A0A3D9INA7_9BACL|nr:class I SAM-dependent methyltransferase [Cohnella lupini]RED63264.1 ubiquinone/menaquinone biosynthesis C-methylase UbiE [Cohnella lupini]